MCRESRVNLMGIEKQFSTCSAHANYGRSGLRKLEDTKLVKSLSRKKRKITGEPNQAHRLDPSIYIVKTNNIILTQVFAALHFDHDEINNAGIFQSVFVAGGYVSGFVRRNH